MKRVKNLAEFKALVANGYDDFAIVLGGGGVISRKNIRQLPNGRYDVFHGIDGSISRYTERELLERTNIGRALTGGALYYDEKSGGAQPVALTS